MSAPYTHHGQMFGQSVQSYANYDGLVTVDLQCSNGSAEALKDLTIEEATTVRDLLTYAIRDAEENHQ